MNQTIVRKTKSPQNHTSNSRMSINQNRSTLKSADKDSVSDQPIKKTKVKSTKKPSTKVSKGISKQKFDESLQKAYEKYVGRTPTIPSDTKISKTRTSESENKKKHKKDSKPHSAEANLQSKVTGLQKTIDSQEKMLHDLQYKLTSEKSELSQISQRISGKRQQDRLDDGVPERDQTNKSTLLDDRYIITEDQFMIDDGDKEIKQKTVPITREFDSDKNPTRILQNERIIEAYSSEENYKHKWLHLKEHVSSIESHYELKIKQLKQEVAKLTEENYRLRYRKGITGPEKDDPLERLESMYKAKIAKAEEKYEQKEREIMDREKTFKVELQDVYSKIERLQLELRKNRDTDEKISELKRQLALRENEISLVKKHYSEKLQMKTEELAKQKEEWSKMHRELLEEIRGLKKNIDELSYENKKLSLNNNHQNTAALISSLRT